MSISLNIYQMTKVSREVKLLIELEAKNEQGLLVLSWNRDTEFRLMHGKVVIYNGEGFPQNPDHNIREFKYDDVLENPWNTNLPYGPGYYIARTAQGLKPNSPDHEYHRIVDLVTE